MLRIHDLFSGYKSHMVIKGLSMEVNSGDIVALVGPNGAGKTTLLRTIIGLIPASSGRISFLEEDITDVRTDRIINLGMTYVPEGISLFPRMSVKENLVLASMASRNKQALKIEDVLSLFPSLKEKFHIKAGHLAGGQRRMLTIARGLVCGPRLILLDDPFLGLSPKIVLKLCDFLRDMNRKGLTILIIGQHVKRILRMSTRAYFLEEGHLTLSGKGAEFLRNHHFREKLIGLRTKGDL